ncbi:MAG: HEPN domain-containing protein, partial [Promethearchaeota archaeon]
MQFSSRGLKALKRAKRWLQGAQRGLEDKRWDDCVYCSQMAAEQSMKGLLILLGVSFKRIHDISDFVLSLQNNSELSKEFRSKIPQITDELAELTE